MDAYDRSKIESYLAATDAELKVFIDPAHMSYLPVYLGRADARHALGEAPEAVLRELWLAAKVYADHGAIFLTKQPVTQVRRRRLDPFEVGLIAGDPDVLKALARVYGVDAMTLFAGIEPDAITAEVAALTGYFAKDVCEDPIDLAGALALFYWLMLSSVASEDAEGFEVTRRRATRCLDDFGHMAGGASGGIARIRTIHKALQALRPPRPDAFAREVLTHAALWKLEHDKLRGKDEDAATRGAGGLDKTALALLALGKAFGLELAGPLAAAGAEPWLLGYAQALGHVGAGGPP